MSPKETPKPKEINETVESYLDSVEKNPEKHLDALMKHAKGYLREHKDFYQKRKEHYERHLAEHRANPAEVKAPFKDPFVINYEAAKELVEKLDRMITEKKDPKLALAEFESKEAEGLNEDVKKLANYIWIRTVMPKMPLVSNVVKDGARYMIFQPDENGRPNKMTVYPSGAIKVISSGKGPTTYLPPFPGVEIKAI